MPVDPQQIYSILSEIRTFCKMSGEPAVVKKYARYFTEGYDAYGVPREKLESYQEALFTEYREELGLEGFMALADQLFTSGKHEEATLGIGFVKGFKKQLTAASFERIGRWLDGGVRNWAQTDAICSELLPYFLIKGIVTLKDLESWRLSDSKWKRRAAAVALIKLLKQSEDIQPMLDFIRPMMLDRERVVHQGLGWFLREAWKRQPAVVENFLLEWKDSAPRLIIRYATERMEKEHKMLFHKQSS